MFLEEAASNFLDRFMCCAIPPFQTTTRGSDVLVEDGTTSVYPMFPEYPWATEHDHDDKKQQENRDMHHNDPSSKEHEEEEEEEPFVNVPLNHATRRPPLNQDNHRPERPVRGGGMHTKRYYSRPFTLEAFSNRDDQQHLEQPHNDRPPFTRCSSSISQQQQGLAPQEQTPVTSNIRRLYQQQQQQHPIPPSSQKDEEGRLPPMIPDSFSPSESALSMRRGTDHAIRQSKGGGPPPRGFLLLDGSQRHHHNHHHHSQDHHDRFKTPPKASSHDGTESTASMISWGGCSHTSTLSSAEMNRLVAQTIVHTLSVSSSTSSEKSATGDATAAVVSPISSSSSKRSSSSSSSLVRNKNNNSTLPSLSTLRAAQRFHAQQQHDQQAAAAAAVRQQQQQWLGTTTAVASTISPPESPVLEYYRC